MNGQSCSFISCACFSLQLQFCEISVVPFCSSVTLSDILPECLLWHLSFIMYDIFVHVLFVSDDALLQNTVRHSKSVSGGPICSICKVHFYVRNLQVLWAVSISFLSLWCATLYYFLAEWYWQLPFNSMWEH
jgi:hypothetical protein